MGGGFISTNTSTKQGVSPSVQSLYDTFDFLHVQKDEANTSDPKQIHHLPEPRTTYLFITEPDVPETIRPSNLWTDGVGGVGVSHRKSFGKRHGNKPS